MKSIALLGAFSQPPYSSHDHSTFLPRMFSAFNMAVCHLIKAIAVTVMNVLPHHFNCLLSFLCCPETTKIIPKHHLVDFDELPANNCSTFSRSVHLLLVRNSVHRFPCNLSRNHQYYLFLFSLFFVCLIVC